MTTQSLDVLGLSPNQNYIVKVFATYTDPSGVVHVSDYSPPLQISAPSLSASGANITTSNYGTDIQLAGGSLFAGDFPSNVGQIDLTTTSPNGTGVIVSQTGIGAWNAGTQQFFLNAKTGAATFAGTITSPSLQSANYSASLSGSEPKYSVAGTFIDLTNGAISAPKFRITSSGYAYFGGDVTGASYSGVDLQTWAGGIAQTAANGKNTVGYGPTNGLTGTTSGYGPNGTIYYVSGGTPVFPSTISYSTANQQKGDTFFSYNAVGNIIAQYTATSGSSWSKTLITSQTISELDVGKLTAGTINVAISLTAATIIGGLIENSGYSGVTDGSSFSTSGMAINLANSTITAPKFRITSAGYAYFAGNVDLTTTFGSLGSGTSVPQTITAIGNTTGSSASITLSSISPSTGIITAGMPVSGTGIPVNSYVLSVQSSSLITLNIPVSLSGVSLIFSTPTASSIISAASAGITKNQTFTSSTQPTANNVGDLWIDSTNKMWRWNGTSWTSVQDNSISTALSTATAAQNSANGKNTIKYSLSTPTGTGADGDLWFQFNGSNNIIGQWTYNLTSTSWVSNTITSTVIANLDAGKITTGTLSAITISGTTITGNTINNGGGTFTVDTFGNVNATSMVIGNTATSNYIQLNGGNMVIKGVITATAGYIGTPAAGWAITSNAITATASNSTISGGTITGSTIIGSQFNTNTGTTSNILIAGTTVAWYDTGGSVSQISSSSGAAANGLHFFVPGGVEAFAIYGSGTAGAPNKNISNQPLVIGVNTDTTASSVRNIRYSTGSYDYTGTSTTALLYGEMMVQYV